MALPSDAQKKKPAGPARPPGGLPGADGMSPQPPPGPPPGGDDQGIDPSLLAMGGGWPPNGGAGCPQCRGMPKPGQPMDPMQAMLGGLGGGMGMPPPPPAPGPPMGPGGLPVGGTQPSVDPWFNPEMSGSTLMQGISRAIGDPYAAGPEGHADLDGMGPQQPDMGLEQLIQLIAMAQSGAGPDAGGGMPPMNSTSPSSMLGSTPDAESPWGNPRLPAGGMGLMGVKPGGSGVNFDRGRYNVTNA